MQHDKLFYFSVTKANATASAIPRTSTCHTSASSGPRNRNQPSRCY